jgi:hypothetical protein
MSDEVWVSISVQVGTLLVALISAVTTIVVAYLGMKKLNTVQETVNGHSTAQAEKIEELHKTVASLSAVLAGRRADDGPTTMKASLIPDPDHLT